MPTENLQSEPNGSPTRQDLTDSTRVITDHVDERTESMRSDLASRTESVREQVIDAANHSDRQTAAKTEAIRVQLADRTEEARANLEEKYDARRTAVNDRFTSYRTWFIFAVIAISLTNTLLYYLFLNPRAGKPVFILGEPVITSSTELCPGESLDFSASVNVTAKGVYVLDQSVWRTSPPPSTVILSVGERMVIGGNRNFPVVRKWIIPKTYIDPTTNENVEWTPGQYLRDISVTAGGKNVESSTKSISFSIRPDCTS